MSAHVLDDAKIVGYSLLATRLKMCLGPEDPPLPVHPNIELVAEKTASETIEYE